MAGSLDWDETTTSNIFFSDEGELAISTGRDVAQPEPSESERSKHSKELPTDIDFDFHTTHMLELGGHTRGRLLQDKEEAGAVVRMLHEKISDQQRLLVAHEILREHFGHQVNRCSRARVPRDKYGDELILLGHLYSALEKFITSNPDYSDKCNKSEIEAVAEGWVPGAESTLA
ncbi:hypothetical protein TGAM01_v209094 [Trichoderma gamsii]|uniref:Uncharacterized protein n=1 Tax=Trichoderma gamsii TaxID=398673 RepID=A0A2P4ZCK0_9HYPO|nr:hypothetical protein TGAM01_v209094 [Trichoderma gamsii]PON22024.1 hypothetical protein TGAM01_v209094 [Trichoderma gamsii]